MSIIVNYQRLSPEKFQHLRADPKVAASYFGDDLEDEDDDGWYAFLDARKAGGRFLSIGKNWQGLHFLLTGSANIDVLDPGNPLEHVINGAETEWEASYGFVEYLTAKQVQSIADALDAIREEQLRSRYDVAAFRANSVYPLGDEWQDRHVEWPISAFREVRQFMQQAARDGEMVLISFS